MAADRRSRAVASHHIRLENTMNIETTLEAMRSPDDYNWDEVFKYGDPKRTFGDLATPTDSFGLSDVAEILASAEGENDGDSWLAVGRLADGRFFYIEAGCDYTGWG